MSAEATNAAELHPRVALAHAHQSYVMALRGEGLPADRQALDLAMAAKELVFRAQDAAGGMPGDAHARRVHQGLAKVRSQLEALDRLMRPRAYEVSR